MAAPTRRDLLECIKSCHYPRVKIEDSDYYECAVSCLKKLLPSSSTSSEEDFVYTAGLFVDYVRKLYRKSNINRHYKALNQLGWFDEELVLKNSPPPKTAALPLPPPPKKQRVTRKLAFEEMGKRQQDYTTAKIREQHEGPAIVQAAVQYFRQVGCHGAAYVLKEIQTDPQEVGEKVRKYFVETPENLPQVSRARCLAYILDRGMTHVDWDETVKLVNTPGNRRLPCYSLLNIEKQKIRPRGKHFSHFTLS